MKTKLLILIAAIAALSAIAFAGLASAHSRPIRFEPSPGQVLQTAPSQVSGWFTGELRRDPNWTFLHVTDAQGSRIDAGEAQFSSDRLQMTVPLKTGLGPGRYQVTWRGFDDGDGAILGDCYVFYVGQAAADQAIKDRQRLDGGGSRECARIDVEAANGTPVANGTPQGTVTADDEEGEGEDHDSAEGADASNDDSGVPAWTVVLGVVAGLTAGAAGMKFVGTRG